MERQRPRCREPAGEVARAPSSEKAQFSGATEMTRIERLQEIAWQEPAAVSQTFLSVAFLLHRHRQECPCHSHSSTDSLRHRRR
jgi:hypothetical protein